MSILKANRIENLTTTDGGININNSGNVGIGTSSPANILHLSATGTPTIQITDEDNSGIVKIENGSGSLFFNADTGNTVSNSRIQFGIDGSERLRINSSGYVGIGETSPDRLLHLKNTSDTAQAKIETTASSGRAQIQFKSPHGDWLQGIQGATTSGDFLTYTADSKNILWFTGGSERMRVNNSGVSVSSGNLSMHSGGRIFVGNGGNAVNPMFANVSDTNTGIAFPSADTMLLSTGGSERLRIDSSGNVGIGVTNPSSYASNANNLVVGNTSSTNGITILTGTGNAGGINFADGTGGTDRGRLDYDHGDDRMRFYTASSERMRIDSSGNVGIGTATINRPLVVYGNSFSALSINTSSSGTAAGDGVQLQLSGSNGYLWNYENGGIHFGTNGTERMRILSSGGLTFNGDTAAANALDDYEEGTWTAAFSSGITSAGYSSQAGTYTKIGRLVTFTLHLRANSGTNAGSEQVRISGLPFTAGSSADEGGAFFNYRGNLDSGIGPFMHIGQNQNVIRWYSASGGNWVGTDGSGIKNHAFHIQGYYYAAS